MPRRADGSRRAAAKVLTGNHAVSYGAMLARSQVISAYPITPQTQIVELLSEFCASGRLDAKFIKVESEHSAMAALIGASTAGARAFTATSAQGLALMHELLHWAAGGRLPIVMADVNRAMAPGWSVWTDQNDSLSQRDTGWLQFYCESNQEVLDTVIQAFRIAEQVFLPVMLVLDAFVLSHTSEPVIIPDQKLVDRYLPPYKPRFRLDNRDPRAFSALIGPDHYTEMRYMLQQAMEEAKRVAVQADDEYRKILGRGYGVIEPYRCAGADTILVTSSTVTGTARTVIDAWRARGRKVGLLKVRMFRPFPAEAVKRVLGRAKKVAVFDRNLSYGGSGIFCQEIKAAFCNETRRPMIFGFVAGLGGRDVTPSRIEEILDHARRRNRPEEEVIFMDVRR